MYKHGPTIVVYVHNTVHNCKHVKSIKHAGSCKQIGKLILNSGYYMLVIQFNMQYKNIISLYFIRSKEVHCYEKHFNSTICRSVN